MISNMSKICLCDSGKPFQKCCGRYLNDNAIPATPKQLMRSRYTAYALGNYGKYLLATWHPEKRTGLTAALLSEKSLNWVKLEVINNEQKGDEGTVEFKAYYKTNEELNVLHEKSTFKRINRQWYYVEGDVKKYAMEPYYILQC